LLPTLDKVGNRGISQVVITDILLDANRLEDALKILEGEEWENWEGQESSGEYYRLVNTALAMRAAEAGDFTSAEALMAKLIDNPYPENLHYGLSIRFNLADVYLARGKISLMKGDKAAAKEDLQKAVIYEDRWYQQRDIFTAALNEAKELLATL